MPLLALSLLGATAAAPTLEQAATIARTAIDRAQYDLAERTIDDALQRFGSLDNETVWTLYVMRGEILNAGGKAEAAQKVLAKEPPPALRTSKPAVRRQLQLAYASYYLNQSPSPHLEEALRLVAYQPTLRAEVFAKFATLGDPSKSKENVEIAIREARQLGDRATEARALAGLQYGQQRAGNFVDALEWGNRALPLAQAAGLVKVEEAIEVNNGWSYIELGDYDSAEELFTKAEKTSAEIHADGDHIASLIQLGNLRLYKGDSAQAEKYYLDAIKQARPLKHEQLGIALANLASVAVDAGRFADARRYNDEAYQKKTDPDSLRRSSIIDARIAAGEGKYAIAEAKLKSVIKEATKTPTTRWEATGRLAEVFVKSNRADDAIDQFQNAVETVRAARQAIQKPELRLAFYNLTADIFNQYVDFLIQRQRIFHALKVTEEIRVGAIEDALEKTATTRSDIDPWSIAKQQNATILSYWLGSPHSYVWTITPTGVRAAQLAPDTQITNAVNQHRRDLLNARGPSPSGRLLFGMLIPAAARKVPHDGRIIIVADRALHALNFDTLVVPASNHYWIEDAVITDASSIGVLARPHPATTRPPTMLLIGNPPSPEKQFLPLPLAAQEIASVSRHFPARVTVLREAAATPAAYRAASPESFDFIHFVAHGTATRTRPLESAVILGRDNSGNYKLLAGDIVNQKLNARLVTISSCHGAGTRTYTGEGLVGLAWSFLHAGASNVIAALWEVNDSATPQLMDDFYKRATRGEDPAAAFRKAKLGLLRSGGVTRYPRYWAPFVFYSG